MSRTSDGPAVSIPRVETERLVLRGFEPGDAASVTFYADPEVMRFIPRGAWKRDELEKTFERVRSVMNDRWRDNGFGMWAIVLKETGAVIGHCGLARLDGGDEVEVFYLLDKPYWNQGIATEAASAALRFGERLGLKRLVAVAFPDNRASQRVMEKLGMTFAGRAHHFGLELVKFETSAAKQAESDS